MKIDLTGMVDYHEVDTAFRMKLAALFQRFQRAALKHSEKVGLGPVAMAASGRVCRIVGLTGKSWTRSGFPENHRLQSTNP